MVIQVLTVFQGILVSRFLGPVGKGAFESIILWPNLFASLSNFGTKSGISIYAAKSKSKGLIKPAILSGLITGTLGVLVCYLLVPIILEGTDIELVKLTQFFSLFILVNHMASAILSIEHGQGNFKKYNFFRLILNPIYLLSLISLKLLGKLTIETCIYALFFSSAIVLILRLIGNLNSFKLKSHVTIKNIFKVSFSFGLADFLMPIYQYFDKALLLFLLGSTQLGFYSVALTAAGVLSVISGSIATIAFTHSAQNKHSKKEVIKSVRLTFLAYVLLGVPLAFLLPYFIPFVYGSAFEPSVLPSIILIFSSCFQGLGLIIEQSIRGAGNPYKGLISRLVSIIFMGVLGVLLSDSLGLIGVALAFVVAQFMFLILMIKNFKYEGGVSHFIPGVADVKYLFNKLNLKQNKWKSQ
ncbi:hypothetical protein VQ01_09100 [Tamlana sp. s12]|nr:hypothetical protein VQ01_09100 [Tamlana sp. s12]